LSELVAVCLLADQGDCSAHCTDARSWSILEERHSGQSVGLPTWLYY